MSLLRLTTLALVLAAPLGAVETERQYLSGHGPEDAVPWDFYCTAGRQSRKWTRIPVPSCWEQHGFGTYNYGGEVLAKEGPVGMEQGLYSHSFTVPEAWQGRLVRIVFDGSMTDTAVFVNGHSAGATHQGAFNRFSYDITPLLRFGGTNLLEVTVAKVSANNSVNAAEREADYWVFGGIYRPVWLEALPRPHIEWTAIDARADGAFVARVHFGQGARGARVVLQVKDARGSAVGVPLTGEIPSDADTVALTGHFEGIRPWSAETPNLYTAHLALSLPNARDEVHSTTERFGFRSLEVRPNDGVYVNGRKIRLKGVNRHCFWPETARTVSRAQSYADARLIKAANMNAVRMSHYAPDEHFLEACDELGLYVLDELAGWQKPYNIPTGKRLIEALVKRDVNHPSILFWDNGNEGGWMAENDSEFARWDPQARPVLHPWAVSGGINTDHYEKWDSHVKLCAGPEIYMPTEFLHALYDGGGGASLRDYWNAITSSATAAGGFLWALVDEGVARADREGQIDNAGNTAPDGIVGPHREKEGSYFAVRELWSPIQVEPRESLPSGWDKTFVVTNGYDFTSLDRCRFEWRTVRYARLEGDRAGHTVLARGFVQGPPVLPGGRGRLRIPLPQEWRLADALLLTATDGTGEELWTWSYGLEGRAKPAAPSAGSLRLDERADSIEIRAGETTWQVGRTSGHLVKAERAGAPLSLSDGPRLLAYRRNDRVFEDLAGASKLELLTARKVGKTVIVEATYQGQLRSLRWTFTGDGGALLDYSYAFDGPVDLLGVGFDYPEAQVRAKRWLGRGPYRAYRNRLEGGILDVWDAAYNDPVPGETYATPEFKGNFRDWRWLTLASSEGTLAVENLAGTPFLGLFTPKDGVSGLLDFPKIGLAFLDVIPAQRTKFDSTDELGPQAARPTVSGLRRGSVRLSLRP